MDEEKSDQRDETLRSALQSLENLDKQSFTASVGDWREVPIDELMGMLVPPKINYDQALEKFIERYRMFNEEQMRNDFKGLPDYFYKIMADTAQAKFEALVAEEKMKPIIIDDATSPQLRDTIDACELPTKD